MKNLLFASIGEKPELVIRDALTNDVEAARTVVEDLDVVEDIGPSHLSGLVDALADTLLLQAAEE